MTTVELASSHRNAVTRTSVNFTNPSSVESLSHLIGRGPGRLEISFRRLGSSGSCLGNNEVIR